LPQLRGVAVGQCGVQSSGARGFVRLVRADGLFCGAARLDVAAVGVAHRQEVLLTRVGMIVAARFRVGFGGLGLGDSSVGALVNGKLPTAKAGGLYP